MFDLHWVSFRPLSSPVPIEDGMYATLEDEVMEYLDPSRDKAGRSLGVITSFTSGIWGFPKMVVFPKWMV